MLRNLPLVASLAVGQLAVYWVLNHYALLPSHALPLTPPDRWIPFWPVPRCGRTTAAGASGRGC